jgi:hypothetical protein
VKRKGHLAGMFAGKEENKLKIEEIRLSPELLRINSRYAGGGGLAKILLILIVSLSLIFYKDIIRVIKDKSPDEQLVLIAMAVLFLAAFFFTLYKKSQNSGKTLIVSEKGLFIEPLLAEFWKDIDEYKCNTSAENVSGQMKGTSIIFFNNKGAWPKTFDLMQYGIFFTPQQVVQVENICSRLGIKKLEG